MRGASLVVIACQGHSRNRTQSRDKHFDKKWAEMFFDQIYKTLARAKLSTRRESIIECYKITHLKSSQV